MFGNKLVPSAIAFLPFLGVPTHLGTDSLPPGSSDLLLLFSIPQILTFVPCHLEGGTGIHLMLIIFASIFSAC